MRPSVGIVEVLSSLSDWASGNCPSQILLINILAPEGCGNHCFYGCVYQQWPQTLAAMCRNMGIYDIFMTLSTRKSISGFYLIPWHFHDQNVISLTKHTQNMAASTPYMIIQWASCQIAIRPMLWCMSWSFNLRFLGACTTHNFDVSRKRLTYVHISVIKWCILDMRLVHCGICATGVYNFFFCLMEGFTWTLKA